MEDPLRHHGRAAGALIHDPSVLEGIVVGLALWTLVAGKPGDASQQRILRAWWQTVKGYSMSDTGAAQ